MEALDAFITTQLYAFLLIFARMGCAFMIMPGLSDSTVPMQIRLYAALTFCFVLTPLITPLLPVIPQEPIPFGLLVIKEMMMGIFIGLMTQIMMNAINLLGTIVAHATSLSSAFTFNPQYASQSPVITGFLSLLVVVMIFVTDLHHMLLSGLIQTYAAFPVKDALQPGDMTDTFAQALSDSFRLGLMIASPFIVVAFGVFLAMGLVARLVPQIQVFILSIPVQVLTGLLLFMTSLSAIMMFFLDEYSNYWQSFVGL